MNFFMFMSLSLLNNDDGAVSFLYCGSPLDPPRSRAVSVKRDLVRRTTNVNATRCECVKNKKRFFGVSSSVGSSKKCSSNSICSDVRMCTKT
ncbi:Hypothetical protein, putative [Bodo saltans]|uniref:Uncharacterized protein n=1 Tax=Bodo saltans TaxID=75058 RepID=A0A0S4JPJ2_BODSA|nr:Hypothetical protein, putative [Bodo saltans]|eukprot:CUG93431.1 Hypothetical protein, putative [Bodo saltans]